MPLLCWWTSFGSPEGKGIEEYIFKEITLTSNSPKYDEKY